MSDSYRHFIVGGKAGGRPVLLAVRGTYGPHRLQAYGPGLEPLWKKEFDPAEIGGALGSHVTPVVDIDGDGDDEVFIGERCLSLKDGSERFCCGREDWTGHSDIVQPVLNRAENRWYIWTCRESFQNRPPRLVMFNDRGEVVWSKLEEGHMDTGWAARIGPKGAPVVLGVKVGEKIRTAEGERRTGVVEYAYHAFSGEPVDLDFKGYTTIPVDLNGDGDHELVRGYFEGDGAVYDRQGKPLGNIDGLAAMCSKFTSHPGEQILSYGKDGVVRIWRDKNAADTEAALARYRSDFYKTNQRLTGVGYNLFTLGGI